MGNIVYGGLTVALLASAGIGAYYVADRSGAERPAAVDADLCRADHELVAHSIVLLDVTDPLSPDERKLARDVVDEEAAVAKPYERVSVRGIRATAPYDPVQLFSACAPKRASDATGISENPRLYEAIWKHKFRAPLDASIDAEMTKGVQDRSPIIESIWAISRLHDFNDGVKYRRLVIVSDMLQNMPSYSQYSGTVNFNTFRRSRMGKFDLPDLRGVEVVIYYLQRPKTLELQTARHAKFWVDFFKAAGATQVTVKGGPRSDT